MYMRKLSGLAIIAVLAVGFALPGSTEERTGDPYALNACPISGKELGSMGDAIVKTYEGREVRFCCEGCPKAFEKDLAASLQKLDAKMIEAQAANYPEAKCINSGADLKEGGVSFIVGNRLFKTCCDKCKAKVQAEPVAFFEKLDKAVIEAQSASYASDKCPLSGEALGDEQVQIVVANKLVKLCCESCKKGVEKNPADVLSKVNG